MRLSAQPAELAAPECYLSLDVDWAEDFMIRWIADRLERSGVAATIFCTHMSPAVQALCHLPHVEIGLHPNFLATDPSKPDELVLRELSAEFPQARGVRNHVLYYHSRLLAYYRQRSIHYISNELMFLLPELPCYFDWTGLVRLPIYWEDDVHCDFFGRCGNPLDGLHWDAAGLKVFNFHPIHVYLNTGDLGWYHEHKEKARDETYAQRIRRAGDGVGKVFDALLSRLQSQETWTLGRLADRFRDTVGYPGRNADG